jgi:hypothetical protein
MPDQAPEAAQQIPDSKDPLSAEFMKPEQAPAQPQAAAPVDDRPRNPDGTFKKTSHEHPVWLAQAASQFGYSAEEISSTPTEKLQLECNRIWQHREQARQEAANQRTLEKSEARTQEAAAAVESEPDIEDILAEWEKEGVDPRTVRVLRKLAASAKRVDEVETKVKTREQRDAEKEARSIEVMVDEAFEGLGEAGEEWFGKGGMRSLDSKAPESQRRNVVYNNAGIDALDTPKTIAKKIQAAAKLFLKDSAAPKKPVPDQNAYGTEPAATIPKPISANGRQYTAEEWAEAGGARPTHRTQEELPPGDEKAIRNLDAKLRGGDRSQAERVRGLGLLT